MSSRSKKILLLIFVAAAFLRFYDIGNVPPGLYGDEAMNGNNAVTALDNRDFKVFYEENNGREGLFINIQALFLKSAEVLGIPNPREAWVLRAASAAFGTLTVLGIYFLMKELFAAEGAALFSSFLMATGFWHIVFSRIGFRAIMAPFFLVWGLYLLMLSLRRDNKWLPFAAGAVYGLGMHSYISYRATPLLIVIILALLGKSFGWKKILYRGTTFFAAALIVFTPLGLYFLDNPGDFFGRTSDISVFNSPTPLKQITLNILKTAGMFNVSGDWNPRHNIPGAPLLFWPVGILFLIGLALTITNALKNPKTETINSKQFQNSNDSNPKSVSGFGHSNLGFRILLLWLIITALPVVISNEGIPHALRSILMIPTVFMIAALGGMRIYEFLKMGGSRMQSVASFLFLTLLFLNAYQTYFLDWAKRTDVAEAFNVKYVKIAKEINSLPNETPKYLILDTGGQDIRKIGSPAQTIMYLTDTYSLEKQKEKNVRFITPKEIRTVPSGSFIFQL